MEKKCEKEMVRWRRGREGVDNDEKTWNSEMKHTEEAKEGEEND